MTQHRITIPCRTTCTVRDDGLAEVHVHVAGQLVATYLVDAKAGTVTETPQLPTPKEYDHG
jgi:hypothetical protein